MAELVPPFFFMFMHETTEEKKMKLSCLIRIQSELIYLSKGSERMFTYFITERKLFPYRRDLSEDRKAESLIESLEWEWKCGSMLQRLGRTL